MALSDIVNITITTQSRGISRAAFGSCLVCGPQTVFPELSREYALGTAVIDMIADGFDSFDPLVRAVTTIASNTPKSTRVVIGSIRGPEGPSYTQDSTITVLPVEADDGQVFGFNFIDHLGVKTAISYTASGGDDQDAIAAALGALMVALADVTVLVSFATINVAAVNSDEMFYFEDYTLKLFGFQDDTPSDDMTAQLTTVFADTNNWYNLVLATPASPDIIGEAGLLIEGLSKIYSLTTADTNVLDAASVSDIMFGLNALGLLRSYSIFSSKQTAFAGGAWAGGRLPLDPGSQTWAFKAIPGVPVENLTTAQEGAILAKKGNVYTDVAGIGVTQNGTMASGEFIDVIRGRDWLEARIAERIFILLANAPKVPFTDGGIDQVKAQIRAQLTEGINAGYLSPDPTPPFTVTAPSAAEVSPADKINRLLPNVAFTATLAGAIQATNVAGTLQI